MLEVSDLNAPYILPRIGHAAILAGDVTTARSALKRLDRQGTRGRAVDADRVAIRAGLAALDGDRAAALAGYRTALGAWRDLALPWDEALTTLGAVTRLGDADAEVRGWADTARSVFERLGAQPMLARLARAAAGSTDVRAAAAIARAPRLEQAIG